MPSEIIKSFCGISNQHAIQTNLLAIYNYGNLRTDNKKVQGYYRDDFQQLHAIPLKELFEVCRTLNKLAISYTLHY